MKLPFYIAQRYLIAKKSHNAINIISIISVVGVAVGTMALIVILSVFNGFDNLVQSLYNSFYPDIKITPSTGKVFVADSALFHQIQSVEGVSVVSRVVEENALLRYGERQHIATLKGVDGFYNQVTGLDTMIIDGKFKLVGENKQNFAVVGQGVAYYLAIGLNFINPIAIYVPRRTGKISLNPDAAFNKDYIFPSGIFSVEQEIETKYIILPLEFTRKLLEYQNNEVSALEIKIDPKVSEKKILRNLETLLGDQYKVKNRYQQNEVFYKIMKSEKWAIFFILSFIMVVASFNIVGSLTMLIIEKKTDILTLRNLGLQLKYIRRIFLLEGTLITIIGTVIGLILGAIICYVQLKFGLIKLQGSGSFVIDVYPVSMKLIDFIAVPVVVATIGIVASWYPARFITRRYMV